MRRRKMGLGKRAASGFPVLFIFEPSSRFMAKQTMVSHVLTTTISDLTPFVWRPDAAPVAGDIDIDNDGAMQMRGVLDLSGAVSQVIGKQCSQFANYRVNYVSIHLENRDDAIDNDDGANFGGYLEFFKPNKHNVDAMKALRMIDREYRKELVSSQGAFYSGTGGNMNRYNTPRLNWLSTDQKVLPGVGTMAVWSNSELGDYPSLGTLLSIWNNHLVDNAADYSNEVWASRTGITQKLHWSASYQNNADGSSYEPVSRPFIWQSQGNDLEVLGGLMGFSLEHSSVDSPGTHDDDYTVHITVGISGWEAF